MGVNWRIWVIAGSYDVRQGALDNDETWGKWPDEEKRGMLTWTGLLNHNWTSWRLEFSINENIIPMVNAMMNS
jgi:hypothetical protein